ncbi:hypothetical protein [Paractinoplanes durhamensis]|uniref:Excreted virulence factor EspC (Type VII ESX diderm) n=1 Tax=Paractinoplanes durhamensis TaxID=113563 RepID=A0ABQ3Z6C3_9ACTN|nr:hypothetical protein [Actinoplanes durhamensis]GIE05365.1 hypothetical protein Adu01nite_67150 [Actinoplanes durhamensis]
MTDDDIEFDPAWQGARLLSAAGRELGAQRHDVGAAGTPWGADEAGRAFERRYREVETQVLTAWEQLAAYVESLGDVAARAAQDNLDSLDTAAAAHGRRERP